MSHIEILAVLLFAIGGFFKNPRKTIAIYMFSNMLFLLVYFELGLFMACISLGLASIRGVAALFLNDEQNKYSVIFFTLAIIVLIALEISHYADFLIIVAALAIGCSTYFRDHLYLYWSTTILSQALWVVHSLIFEVYGMLICASVIIATGLYAICKNTDFTALKTKLFKPSNKMIVE